MRRGADMRRLLLSGFLISGACAASTADSPSPAAPASTPAAASTIDWEGAVSAEAKALEAAHPGATVRIVVLDASGSTVLAQHGEVEVASATGSTMKTLTVYAALRAGLDPTIEIDTSAPLELDGERIFDASDNGVLTLPQAIARSSNVAVARVLETVPWAEVYATVAELVPLPDPAGMSMVEAVGQLDGFVTRVPLRELVGAYATMASAPEGEAVLEMLRLAVTPAGTGEKAAVPGLEVLGKTGTARQEGVQDAVFVGRVSNGETTAWIGVSVHDVAKEAYGSVVAAPAFAHIVTAALR